MPSDVGVGDSEIAYIDIAPADADTSPVLTVYKPDGTDSQPPVSGGPLDVIEDTDPVEYLQRWTSTDPVTYDQAGRWVLRWVVAPGVGEGAEDKVVYVVPAAIAGGPTWWPGLSRVAAYVPHRTLVRDTATTIASQDQYAWTFDATTTPQADAVWRLIQDGAAWVTARTTSLNVSLNVSLYDTASVIVALYCAAFVERGWPSDGDSLQRATDLERRMDFMLQTLVDANNIANDTGDYGIDIVPQWSSQRPDLRWGCPTYW